MRARGWRARAFGRAVARRPPPRRRSRRWAAPAAGRAQRRPQARLRRLAARARLADYSQRLPVAVVDPWHPPRDAGQHLVVDRVDPPRQLLGCLALPPIAADDRRGLALAGDRLGTEIDG